MFFSDAVILLLLLSVGVYVSVINNYDPCVLFVLGRRHRCRTIWFVQFMTLPKNEHLIFGVLKKTPLIDQQHSFARFRYGEFYSRFIFFFYSSSSCSSSSLQRVWKTKKRCYKYLLKTIIKNQNKCWKRRRDASASKKQILTTDNQKFVIIYNLFNF